jgi:hypothetical protein
MTGHASSFHRLLVAVGILLGLTVTTSAYADSRPQVVRPNSKAFAMTYGEWSARWWQYVYGLPEADHPLTDETGERCAVGQWGPVFFLMGTTISEPVTRRKCIVPAGKGILFPIVNFAGAVPEDGATADEITEVASSVVDLIDVDSLSVRIDGRIVDDLEDFRFKSPIFSFTGETPNVFSQIGCGAPPCYEGFRETAFADGYWILLRPLSPGRHTIRFHGEVPDFDFVVDVTYHLRVRS